MQNHAKMQTQKKHARMQNCNKQGANAKMQKSMQECNTTKRTQRCKRSMQECKPENKTKHRCERVCKSGKLQKQRKNANMQKRARTQTCKKQGADAEQHKECNAARTLQRCKRSLREHKRAKRQKGGDAKAHASLHHLQNALPSPPYFSLSPSPPCSSPRVEVCQCLERLGGADELVEDADNVGKFGAPAALLLPALHHQLVDGRGAVQRGGQAETLVDGLHHLQGRRARGEHPKKARSPPRMGSEGHLRSPRGWRAPSTGARRRTSPPT